MAKTLESFNAGVASKTPVPFPRPNLKVSKLILKIFQMGLKQIIKFSKSLYTLISSTVLKFCLSIQITEQKCPQKLRRVWIFFLFQFWTFVLQKNQNFSFLTIEQDGNATLHTEKIDQNLFSTYRKSWNCFKNPILRYSTGTFWLDRILMKLRIFSFKVV
jgi:hypothetical protein